MAKKQPSPTAVRKFMREHLKRARTIIQEHGWIVQNVLSDPPLSYTVGLHAKGLPELVMVGVDVRTMQPILNALARRMVEGDLAVVEGLRDDRVFERFPAMFRRLPQQQVTEHLDILVALSQEVSIVPEVYQVVWPDEERRFPGEEGVAATCALFQDLETAARQYVA